MCTVGHGKQSNFEVLLEVVNLIFKDCAAHTDREVSLNVIGVWEA